jgi:hypothetical protein
MLSPYELIAKATLPAIRAQVARILLHKYGLSQQEVAKRLGITQAAVSNYSRGVRGSTLELDDEEVRRHVDELARMLVEQVDKITVTAKLIETVELVKKKRLMCDFHKQLEPDIVVDECTLCDSSGV